MLGVIVNTIAVIIGSSIGLIVNKAIPEKIMNTVITALGLCTIYIGFSGTLSGKNVILIICSMVLGVIIGTLLDIDGHLNKLGLWFEKKLKHKNENNKISISKGFVSASLLFCVGAMTIVGSIKAGIFGDNQLLYTKSTLDLIASIMLSASLGIGVMLSAVFVFLFQGALVIISALAGSFLSDYMIAEIGCCGSLIIVALGFNLLGITKIKIADFLPAIIIAPLLCLFIPQM